MSSISVIRLPGNRPGPDIVDPLLATDRLRLARGRAQIDSECSSRETVGVSARHLGWIAPGSLVQVVDLERGTWFGIVDRCEIVYTLQGTEFTADTNLTIEREKLP